MATSVTTQATVATGDTIEAAYSNTARDNVAVLDVRTGGNPGGANKWLVSSGTLGAAWVAQLTAVLAAIGYTPVNQAGDTMTGVLVAPGAVFTQDTSLYRASAPTTGLLYFGSGGAHYLYWDGTKFNFSDALSAVGMTSTGDVTVYRAGAPTTGLLYFGNSGAHSLYWDGTTFNLAGPLAASGAISSSGAISGTAITGSGQVSGVGMLSTGDVSVYRAGANTTGYVTLGIGGAKYIGNDGTNEVTSTGKIWTAGNDGPASGLDAQTAATAANVSATIGGVALASYNAPTATSATSAGTATSATTATTANGVAAGSVTDVGIAAGNKDGVAGTASMRTLGTGGQQAAAGNHAHTNMATRTTGTYSGNGSATQTIALGLSATMVLVTEVTDASNGVGAMAISGKTYSTRFISGTTAAATDASNGISGTNLVASGTAGINNSGKTYTWVAIA